MKEKVVLARDVNFSHEELVEKTLVPQFRKYYFCGHSLDQVLNHAVIKAVGPIVLQHGICYEAAAMIMLALHDFPSSRIIHGIADSHNPLPQHRSEHAWVEITIDGVKLVIDPCSINSTKPYSCAQYCAEFDLYHDIAASEVLQTISYDEFWHFKLSHQLAHRLRDREQSVAASGLLCAYRPCNTSERLSTELLEHLAIDPLAQVMFIMEMCIQDLWSPYFALCVEQAIRANDSAVNSMMAHQTPQ